MKDINFELLQKEINETENYLRGKHENPRIALLKRDSQNVNQTQASVKNDSFVSSLIDDSANKYSDPFERYSLINKVIFQHNTKYFDDVVFDIESPQFKDEWLFKKSDSHEDTIFFASDLPLQTTSISPCHGTESTKIQIDDEGKHTQSGIVHVDVNDQSVGVIAGVCGGSYFCECVENKDKSFDKRYADNVGSVFSGEEFVEPVTAFVPSSVFPAAEAENELNKKYRFQPKIRVKKDQSMSSMKESLLKPTTSSRGREVVRLNITENSLQTPTRPRLTEFRTSQRVDELYADDQARRNELVGLRRDRVALELSECTFQPQLSKGTRAIVSRNQEMLIERQAQQFSNDQNSVDQTSLFEKDCSNPSPLDVSNRLFEEGKSRATQQQWVERQIQDARVAQFSFQPSVNPLVVSMLGHQPLFERIAQVQREKKQHMIDLREAVEEEQMVHLTFVPKIDQRSRCLVQRRESGVSTDNLLVPGLTQARNLLGIHRDTGSRLMEEGRAATLRKQQLVQEREAALVIAMKPSQISLGTKRIAQISKVVSASFLERQSLMHDRRILGQQELRRSDARVMGSWFQPILASNKSVSILSKSRPEQLIENTEERVVRMTYRDADAVEDRRQNLERKLYDHFSFRPQIDPLSKSLGRYTGIDELSENPRGKALLERAQRDRERQQNKECSFQPRINKLSRQLLLDDNDEVFQRTYLNDFTPQTWAEGENAFQATEQRQEQGLAHQRPVSPRINMSEPDKMARDIRTHLAMKEERRRAELVLEEIRQLEGCTFWPSVVPFKPPSISKPVVVRGLGRHLELKHLSVRQKADRGLRENEVFKVRNVDKFRRADDGTTVVQPFKMHNTSPRSGVCRRNCS